jgi:hypothetical protein
MIDFKKYNYINGDKSSVASGVHKIVNFMELEGYSTLLLTTPRTNGLDKKIDNTSLKHLISNQISFECFEEFESICQESSNFFRLDILVCDFWHLDNSEIYRYKKLLSELKVKWIFIVAKEHHYKSTDDVTDIELVYEYKGFDKSTLHIKERISNLESTFDNLKKSYIRDVKINKLLGE